MKPVKAKVEVDTEQLEQVTAALRLCLSQVGFALDNLLIGLADAQEDSKPKQPRDERKMSEVFTEDLGL